jgi:hypothetical protein
MTELAGPDGVASAAEIGLSHREAAAYRMEVGTAIERAATIALWRAHFADFWPAGNRFAGALTGINPGDVALLDLMLLSPVTALGRRARGTRRGLPCPAPPTPSWSAAARTGWPPP